METKNESQTNEIDFLSSKEFILKEISGLDNIKNEKISLPEIFPEKNEIKVKFLTKSLSKEKIFDCLSIIKKHIENIRIHTFEENFYSFQALNENLFSKDSILDNIKFRFSIFRENLVEISKKGNLKMDEIYAIISIFKYLNSESTAKSINPKELLIKLGTTVFDPSEEKAKNNTLDFDHIAGYENVKREILESIIFPIQNPSLFDEMTKLTRKFPAKNRPRAVLFEGDPGVGKTTMAKLVSYKCEIPLIYVPIESILSKYYGESSQNLAYIFDAASLFPSALIFLDEIDSLAGNREEGMFEATRKMLSVLLRKLDGFEGKPSTITIGATNRKKDLDSALVSRFDKVIYFPLPNLSERAEILGAYAIHLLKNDRISLSKEMDGFSGRNIKDFCDYVERKWTTQIIEKKLDFAPPPTQVYLDSIKILAK
ncbi:MAG: AAA family ATPase [Leptospiraceae bacterium]|nr:ATP-binding protein [Leptospiraceae bacterium]MCK6380595.1 AAA family ATPase [Leptospiraceae bacterium]